MWNLIGTLFAVVIGAILMVTMAAFATQQHQAQEFDQLSVSAAGTLSAFTGAATSYANANPPAAGSRISITADMLKGQGYLPQNFTAENFWGQTLTASAYEPPSGNVLPSLVAWYVGKPSPAIMGRVGLGADTLSNRAVAYHITGAYLTLAATSSTMPGVVAPAGADMADAGHANGKTAYGLQSSYVVDISSEHPQPAQIWGAAALSQVPGVGGGAPTTGGGNPPTTGGGNPPTSGSGSPPPSCPPPDPNGYSHTGGNGVASHYYHCCPGVQRWYPDNVYCP
jgi:hypothetical protein